MKQIILLSALVLMFAALAFAQPKTVTDYFLAMPNDVYSSGLDGTKAKGKAAITKLRKSLIKIEDIKNGYLKLEGTWEGWAEIALFKKTDGSYIIAQAENGCGPACDGFVKFWTYNAGKWSDITKSVFTDIDSKQAAKLFNAKKPAEDEAVTDDLPFYYLLPREGKTLKLACNECSQQIGGAEDFVFLEYEWNGTKFVKK